MPSRSNSVKIQIMGWMFTWGNKAKHCWALSTKYWKQKADANKLFVFNILLTMPSNVLPLHLKQTFPPIIWIFTESESDGIEYRLPFKIISTLSNSCEQHGLLFEKNVNDWKFLKSFHLLKSVLFERHKEAK